MSFFRAVTILGVPLMAAVLWRSLQTGRFQLWEGYWRNYRPSKVIDRQTTPRSYWSLILVYAALTACVALAAIFGH